MSRLALCFAVCVLFVAATAPEHSPPPPKQVPNSGDVNRGGDNHQNDAGSGSSAVVKTQHAAVSTDAAGKDARDPDEKRSQEIVMWSAAIQAVSAAIVAILTGVLIFYSHKGWKVAEQSANASKVAAEATASAVEITRLLERPWIKATPTARTHLAYESDGPWLTFWLTLRNVGHSIATDIRYGCKMFDVKAGQTGIADAFDWEPDGRGPVQMLLPGEKSKQLVHVFLSSDAVGPLKMPQENGRDMLSLGIVGVVTYRFPMSDIDHTTRFIYFVGRYEHERARIVVRSGETVPAAEICFLKEPTGSYAD